jgi:alkyldihydroxyacetonephosphate synthase
LVAFPRDEQEVVRVLEWCDRERIAVSPYGGGSSVAGGVEPPSKGDYRGAVSIDLGHLNKVVEIDRVSRAARIQGGVLGPAMEDQLRPHGYTLRHYPQSFEFSTLGGWLATRSGGHYATLHTHIDDFVESIRAVTPRGVWESRRLPGSGAGPSPDRALLGSEGTLGVITGARLRVRPSPEYESSSAWALTSFTDGLELLRRVVRRGATPAVLRLYDDTEADRSYKTGSIHLVLARDEGDPVMVDATMRVLAEEAKSLGAQPMDDALVEQWMEHRNDVTALEALISRGFVVDTMEVAGRWAALPRIYRDAVAALQSVAGTLAASAHQSHSYVDGGCLYFTFAGKVDPDDKDRYYTELWDVGQRAVLAADGALSHHHGVGLNRSRFVAEALGPAFDTLVALKHALDPDGILNPGKLGLPSPFGPVGWP